MKEKDIRLLMEVSKDSDLRQGWMRGVEVQRTQSVKAGKLMYVKSYPIWDTTTRRDAEAHLSKAKERKGTTAVQKRLNARHASERLEQLINANFGAGDLLLSLTYRRKDAPQTVEESQKHVRNFLARLRRLCRKQGAPDPQYVYVTETKTSKWEGTTYHHHMALKVALPRDEVEALWRKKHGYGDIKIAWDKENNLTQWAKYMAKEVCAGVHTEEYAQNKVSREADESRGHNRTAGAKPTAAFIGDVGRKHRWCASKGLKVPPARESDKKISRRRVEAIAKEMQRDPDVAKMHMEACYPGYEVLEMTIRTSEWVGGAYVQAVMTRRE